VHTLRGVNLTIDQSELAAIEGIAGELAEGRQVRLARSSQAPVR
jgi:hypothetical protein